MRQNAARNGVTVDARVGNVFDELRGLERLGERFDTIVLDPPAFAKSKAAVAKATAGYKEINLRALKLLNPGGMLVTCSCSYNVSEAAFAEIVYDAAVDAQAHVTVVEKRMQGRDHPVLLGVPETYYLKCFILRKLGVSRPPAQSACRAAGVRLESSQRMARPAGEFDASRYFRGAGRSRLLQRRHEPPARAGDGDLPRAPGRLDGRRCAGVRRRAHRRSVSRGRRQSASKCWPLSARRSTPRLLPAWKRWLANDHSANWATTDSICGSLIGPLLLAHPALVRTVAGWCAHRNMWVRRASAVGLIPSARQGLALDETYRVAHGAPSAIARTSSRRPSAGCCAKPARPTRSRLERYLRKHGPLIPRTTLRYAIERFPAGEASRVSCSQATQGHNLQSRIPLTARGIPNRD